jgi:hypothetical protein
LFLLAARRELGEGAGAEVVHLSDGAITPIELGASALDRGREEIEQILAGIAERRHAPRPRATECARCPHLFGCTK